jgi:hypothetical protein
MTAAKTLYRLLTVVCAHGSLGANSRNPSRNPTAPIACENRSSGARKSNRRHVSARGERLCAKILRPALVAACLDRQMIGIRS